MASPLPGFFRKPLGLTVCVKRHLLTMFYDSGIVVVRAWLVTHWHCMLLDTARNMIVTYGSDAKFWPPIPSERDHVYVFVLTGIEVVPCWPFDKNRSALNDILLLQSQLAPRCCVLSFIADICKWCALWNLDAKKATMKVIGSTQFQLLAFLCVSIFSSAEWANSITGQFVCACVCVC